MMPPKYYRQYQQWKSRVEARLTLLVWLATLIYLRRLIEENEPIPYYPVDE